MAYGIIRSLSTIFAFTLGSHALAYGQTQITTVPKADAYILHDWESVSWGVPSGRKVLVITMANPTHRIACRVQSFTVDQLTCKGHFGVTHIYKSQEIAALITPGDLGLKWKLLLGFNTTAAAAAWGTLVLAPVCLPCAIATGVVAGLFFFANGAILIGDDVPDTYIYTAPEPQLHDAKGHPIHLKILP